METVLINALNKAIVDGNIMGIMSYGLVFYFIWKEVKGMKDELHVLNKTVTHSFEAGEARFDKIETQQVALEDRLVRLELKINTTKGQ